ncbi:MAG: nodulation protein NfeD [Bryobacteraceae bacterium]|nr:nodulation protein NfeD [Bryobacteraceae bacterium]
MGGGGRMSRLLLLGVLAAAQVTGERVLAVDVDGVIHPITVEILSRAIESARQENAEALLLRLNTPGGLSDATRAICEKLIASPVPVIAWVGPGGARASSAGFFLLQAADVAAMAPGTNTGSASPVLMGQQMDPVLRRKVENDTAAFLRSLVSKRGRNAEVAEKTVREAVAFTEKEAKEQNLIEWIASSEAELLRTLNGTPVRRWDGSTGRFRLQKPEVVRFELSMREKIVSRVADPNAGFVLLVLGILGLYAEFTSPGLVLPGVVGAIALLLGLSALSVLPINALGVALLVLSVALFVLEAKYASHGILGAGGAVAMVLGAVLLIEGPPELRIQWKTALAVAVPFSLITMFLLSLVMKARRNKSITAEAGMVNQIGEAYSDLNPAGKVFIRGEYWDAEAALPLPAGTQVRVTGVDGMRLRVERAGPSP